MYSPLAQLLKRVDEFIGGLIDVADMPDNERFELKEHLLAAQDILVRNGMRELNEFISGVTEAIFSRF